MEISEMTLKEEYDLYRDIKESQVKELKDALTELARYCKCQHCIVGLLTEKCHVQKLLSDK